MKTFFAITTMALCAIFAFGWQHSCQTTWNGSVHQMGSVSFTPGSSTAYVSECSPIWEGDWDCPVTSFDYHARAVLRQTVGPTAHIAESRCGGNSYSGPHSVTTSENWVLEARIDQAPNGGPQSEQEGPVIAIAAGTQITCSGS